MLFRLITGFSIVFIGCSILGAIFAGGGGMVSETLDSDVSANATFIPFDTAYFANKDVLTIGSENILYESKNATGVTVTTRGYGDTDAAAHAAGQTVYTEQSGVINNALDFDVGLEMETGGAFWGLIQIAIQFFTRTLPHYIVLNVRFLSEGALRYVGIFWLAAGMGLLVCLAVQLAPIAVSLVSGLFGFLRR